MLTGRLPAPPSWLISRAPRIPLRLLALALLSTPAEVSAAPSKDEREAASPRIELSATPGGKPAVVCIGPGLPITFRFDSLLQQESLKIQERGWFEDWALGRQTLMLVPRENLVAGKRTEVEVCFADGAAPACATVVLVVHPGLDMQEVKVVRQPRWRTFGKSPKMPRPRSSSYERR